jgi:hypothetical protein
MDDTQTQNKKGQWVPAIPLPFYGLKKRCSCGKSYWTIDGYRGHFAYRHILQGNAAEGEGK